VTIFTRTKRPTKRELNSLHHSCLYRNRFIFLSTTNMSQETCVPTKNPIKETYVSTKNPIKETYVSTKNPIKESYASTTYCLKRSFEWKNDLLRFRQELLRQFVVVFCSYKEPYKRDLCIYKEPHKRELCIHYNMLWSFVGTFETICCGLLFLQRTL